MKFRIFSILLSVLLFASCSPQSRIERLLTRVEKISDKNNLTITTSDTTYNTEVFTETDTFNIDSSLISQTFDIKELNKKQLFVIEDDRTKTTITLRPPTRFKKGKLDVETKSKAQTVTQSDTFKIEVPTYYDRKILIREYRVKWYDWLLRILFIVLIVGGIIATFKNGFEWLKSLFQRN